jgi:hypothetical protein
LHATQILAASQRNAATIVDAVLARARKTFEDDGHGHFFIHLLLVTFLRLVATISNSSVVDCSVHQQHFGSCRSDADSDSCLSRSLFSSSGRLLQRKHEFTLSFLIKQSGLILFFLVHNRSSSAQPFTFIAIKWRRGKPDVFSFSCFVRSDTIEDNQPGTTVTISPHLW